MYERTRYVIENTRRRFFYPVRSLKMRKLNVNPVRLLKIQRLILFWDLVTSRIRQKSPRNEHKFVICDGRSAIDLLCSNDSTLQPPFTHHESPMLLLITACGLAAIFEAMLRKLRRMLAHVQNRVSAAVGRESEARSCNPSLAF